MTTEVVLLLGIFVFLVGRVFFGPHGPIQVFAGSAPRLGARVESQLATGRGFKVRGAANAWQTPTTSAPTGLLQ